MNIRIRRSGSLAMLGVGVWVTMMVAPSANAAITGVSVEQPADGLRTGCSYTVTATVDAPVSEAGEVTIGVTGVPTNGEERWVAEYHPESGTATISWTPTHTGRQNVFAQQFKPGQYTSADYTTVDVVGNGVNTGSSCLPLP
ncbi:hypothetical protein [Nocardia callitridis]|uniref:Ig-like domain-containing protein n=1 Tax=Nocardia callitridis TaxID=648753 RepID=A0ABP9L026_9NOCA